MAWLFHPQTGEELPILPGGLYDAETLKELAEMVSELFFGDTIVVGNTMNQHELLNHLITVSAGIAVMTFLLYTMDASGGPSPIHREDLFYTLPIVVYGIFRYALVTELGLYGGPTDIVLRDKPLLAAILVWAVVALVVVYQGQLFGPEGLRGLFDWPGAEST